MDNGTEKTMGTEATGGGDEAAPKKRRVRVKAAGAKPAARKQSALRQAAQAEPKLLAANRKVDRLTKALEVAINERKRVVSALGAEAKKLLNLGD